LIETFKGPLGSHKNYIVHVALANGFDYVKLKQKHKEEGRSGMRDKYQELRYFVNALESFNNVIDYLYFEYEERIRHRHGTVGLFRNALHSKYPELRELADLANAYKHCVRTTKTNKKNRTLPWARDLQRPSLNINVELGDTPPSINVDVQFDFPGPLEEHEAKLDKVLKFWLTYHNHPTTDDLIAA
jgi:hypothetical protein